MYKLSKTSVGHLPADFDCDDDEGDNIQEFEY